LQGYGGRWSCEVDNFYLKTRLGLADFRVRSYEAVDKYMVVVHLAWGYIERRFIQERAAQVKCYGDIIRRHQEEHAREWLTGALQMVLETGAIAPVLQRFLRETDEPLCSSPSCRRARVPKRLSGTHGLFAPMQR
jgi:hypothetical protein